MDEEGEFGLILGAIAGFILSIVLFNLFYPKVKKSGEYLTYENVIYKQVSEEELDNIIVLEMK